MSVYTLLYYVAVSRGPNSPSPPIYTWSDICVCVWVCGWVGEFLCVCNSNAVAIVFRQTFGDGRARAARTSAITFQLASGCGGVCDPRTKYIYYHYYIIHSWCIILIFFNTMRIVNGTRFCPSLSSTIVCLFFYHCYFSCLFFFSSLVEIDSGKRNFVLIVGTLSPGAGAAFWLSAISLSFVFTYILRFLEFSTYVTLNIFELCNLNYLCSKVRS